MDIERTEYSFLNLIEFKLQNNAKPHPISIDFTYSNANATQNYYVPINLLRLRRAQMARNLSIKIDMPMKLCGNVLDMGWSAPTRSVHFASGAKRLNLMHSTCKS